MAPPELEISRETINAGSATSITSAVMVPKTSVYWRTIEPRSQSRNGDMGDVLLRSGGNG